MDTEIEKLSIQELVDKTLYEITGRSFSGRNPELGKMFMCPMCRTRHRDPRCEFKYAASTKGTDRYDRRVEAILASRAARKAARKLINEIECGDDEPVVGVVGGEQVE
jgi:hypothetical protein